jgi:Mg2+/Co2+ transporter CorB
MGCIFPQWNYTYLTLTILEIEFHEIIVASILIKMNILIFFKPFNTASIHKLRAASKARDIMVPRIELCALEIHDYISKLKDTLISTGFTKILIYTNTIDDIIGYVHSHDLFKNPKSIKSMLLPVEFVPESILIIDLLSILTKKRKSIVLYLY